MKKSSYDKLMYENDKKLRLKNNENYNLCSNKDTDCCILWSACKECYYFLSQLVCPFCDRIIPSELFRKGDGCKWCQQ